MPRRQWPLSASDAACSAAAGVTAAAGLLETCAGEEPTANSEKIGGQLREFTHHEIRGGPQRQSRALRTTATKDKGQTLLIQRLPLSLTGA